MNRSLLARFALALAAAACTGPAGAGGEGATSGAACPPDSALTYETFGQAFMSSYCTECHASSRRGVRRQGAPSDHDLDTLEGVRETEAGHIDESAAAGPAHVNTAMPPASFGRQPSEDERRKLGEWLACGMP